MIILAHIKNCFGYSLFCRRTEHYSYDIHGNVKELIQENPTLSIASQRYKKINYNYDLISGKVNQVAYQPGAADMFTHRYEYDADNRLTTVWTSKDNVIWNRDAKYFYYLHGPLSRMELGHHKVQALDYAYTIQGWIKGVNSNILDPTNDIGKDGIGAVSTYTGTNSLNKYTSRDAYGYSLTYFNNSTSKDYIAINSTSGTTGDFIAAAPSTGLTPDLYNGNIRQMATSYLDAFAVTTTLVTRTLGNKNYELSNHLGNVIATGQIDNHI